MAKKVIGEFIVENESGLHIRPTSSLVKKANEFQSHIELCVEDGDPVDGKSIFGILCLGIGCGSKVKVTAKGTDAKEAVYALGSLFKNKFGESN